MYIAPGTIQQATESEAIENNILYYDITGGKVHCRKFQTFNVYLGTDPLVINYSGYGIQEDYPMIQLTPYMFDESIPPIVIRQVTISYFHDINNQTITVYIGSGSEFRNDFHFSFSLTTSGKIRFHGVAGGLGDNNGNDVIKKIVSINY
jgi:asparagine N-glycosylation enzyme membrane subunit Stt3